jgi:hypothetical protein
MATLSKRSTVYFEPSSHKVLELKAAFSSSSVSFLLTTLNIS